MQQSFRRAGLGATRPEAKAWKPFVLPSAGDEEKLLELFTVADHAGRLGVLSAGLMRANLPETIRVGVMALLKKREGAEEQRNDCIGDVLRNGPPETVAFMVSKATREKRWDVLGLAAEACEGNVRSLALKPFERISVGDISEAIRAGNVYALSAIHRFSPPSARATLLNEAEVAASSNKGHSSNAAAHFLGEAKEFGRLLGATASGNNIVSARAKNAVRRFAAERDVQVARAARDARALEAISLYGGAPELRASAKEALERLGENGQGAERK